MSNTTSSSTSSTPTRIGVIGSGGRIQHVITSLLRESPLSTVTAICDPDELALDRFRREVAPEAAVCDSVDELCTREDVDWVFIGSFNCHHAAQTIAAFRAGKNVFCEKPLSLSLDEAEEMHEAWKSSGRTFALGLVLRYSPLYRMARNFLEEGRIGEILSFEFNETLDFNHGGYIHGNWRRHRELAGTHLLEKCCHDIDLALWLTGSLPTRVASFGGRSFFKPENACHVTRIGNSSSGATAYRALSDPHGVNPFNDDKSIVDHQVAILDFASGIKGTFHTQCNAGIPERRFYFCGTEGSMRLDAYSGELEVGRIGWEKTISLHKTIAGSGHAGGDELMAKELAEVLAESRTPAAGFTEGIRSLVVANAVDEAMDKGAVIDMRPQWKRVASVFGSDDVLDRAC